MTQDQQSEKTDYSKHLSIFLGWLAVSICTMEFFEAFTGVVGSLAPLTTLILDDLTVFSSWNASPPFDTAAARALTAIFILLQPIQIATLFTIPRASLFPKVKSAGAFAAGICVFLLGWMLTIAWGLSITGPLKIFGKQSSWGAAAGICMATIAFSYAVRMLPILMEMIKEERIHSSIPPS